MQIEDFDYQLPREQIAIYPPTERGTSRLLELDRETGGTNHFSYVDLPKLLVAGDLLVINTTKVVPARLKMARADGTEVEILLVEKHRQMADQKGQMVIHRGRLTVGEELNLRGYTFRVTSLFEDGRACLLGAVNLWSLAQEYGEMPIPPYLKRAAESIDQERYQTVFANQLGSVAAPTASLNLTDQILREIVLAGVEVVTLNLHVGLGTFLPVRTGDLTQHQMHSEFFTIPAETVAAIRQAKFAHRRIVAVGTTVTRTLEFAAAQLLQDETVQANQLEGEANIFIYPSYQFQIVDALLTNFHAPRSTVLLMAAAFAGWERLQKAYKLAIRERYQFLSYGDSMLIHAKHPDSRGAGGGG